MFRGGGGKYGGRRAQGPDGGPDLLKLRRLSENAKGPRFEQVPNFSRIGAFVGAAAVVLIVPWLVFTRLGDAGPAKPHGAGKATRAASPTASPSPSPKPTPSTAGHWEILGGVECARLRLQPGTKQNVLNCIKPGVVLWSDGRLATKDGFQWVHVVDPYRRVDGWIAIQYVKKVP